MRDNLLEVGVESNTRFSARLPLRPALSDCQAGMFQCNSRTGRSRAKALGAVSLFPMRDNHDKLPEILNALEQEGKFFCVVQLKRAGETRSYRFGVSRDGYLAVKRLRELRPFDQMPGLSYRHFFVPTFRRLEDANRIEITIRVEQGHNSKQLEVEAPRDLVANLKWFFELEDWNKADHLRIADERKL